MIRALLRRVFSVVLIVLASGGGGGLPVLDGLLFHSRDHGADAQRPHYEATSGCHADRCAIRSTAHESRFLASLPLVDKDASVPGASAPPRPSRFLRGNPPAGQPLSRAPPSFG
jgi:hypothetical protein